MGGFGWRVRTSEARRPDRVDVRVPFCPEYNDASAIFTKLDVRSRAEAVAKARDSGFGKQDAGER